MHVHTNQIKHIFDEQPHPHSICGEPSKEAATQISTTAYHQNMSSLTLTSRSLLIVG